MGLRARPLRLARRPLHWQLRSEATSGRRQRTETSKIDRCLLVPYQAQRRPSALPRLSRAQAWRRREEWLGFRLRCRQLLRRQEGLKPASRTDCRRKRAVLHQSAPPSCQQQPWRRCRTRQPQLRPLVPLLLRSAPLRSCSSVPAFPSCSLGADLSLQAPAAPGSQSPKGSMALSTAPCT